MKLALREGIPVFPVATHGANENLLVVARGYSFGGTLGFDRLRTTVMPLVSQLPSGISIPFVPGIPMPAKITIQVGPALDWSRYGQGSEDDSEVVDRCYEEITGAMQATLDRLAEQHPLPLMERLKRLLPNGVATLLHRR